jgi:SulP family sulfate permease
MNLADVLPEFDQPGRGALREAVTFAQRRLPRRGPLRDDMLAGVNGAVASVPDGMASGALAGVNPIYGLYACMVGPIIGGAFSSTRLMVVTTTSVASLTAGQAVAGRSQDDRANALFVLVLFAGVFQAVLGVVHAGRLTRFVSYSVMTGFIAGIAVLTILSQLPTATGYEGASNTNRVVQTFDVLRQATDLNIASVAFTILAIALAIILPRTFLGAFGTLLAIVIPSIVVLLAGVGSVEIVKDAGAFPGGLPRPQFPDLSLLSPDVVTGGLAVGLVTLIQGAGVSQTVPNPGGRETRMSQDFIAQGAANVGCSVFQGLPVGASLSTTALSVVSGSRTRWAAIITGLVVAVVVVGLSGVIAHVAMPALAALLMVASARTIKPREIRALWFTGWPARASAAVTFAATLLLPIEAAVSLGVVLSMLLFVYNSSGDVTVVQLVERDDGRFEEHTPPKTLASNEVTVLDVYGHLFFAGARTLARELPQLDGAERPVVVLRLRGRADPRATLVDVLSNYADQLARADGRL